MKLLVKIKPNAKCSKVEQDGDGLIVWVNAPAVDGKANKRLKEILSEYLKLPKSRIILEKGLKSKTKILDIDKRGC